MEVDYIHDLKNNSKVDWTIKIRVSRKWYQYDCNNNILGINLIIHDECHRRMHVWVPANIISFVEHNIHAARNYFLHNFKVEAFTGKYRCFDAEYHIVLTSSTIITPITETCCFLPKEVFQFTNLKDIPSAPEQDDIVGIIKELKRSDVVHSRSKQPQFYREFVVTDLTTDVTVRFWNNFAQAFESYYHEAEIRPVIIIICSCRMVRNNYNGVTTLKCTPSTTFQLNSDCSRVDILRKRYWEVYGI